MTETNQPASSPHQRRRLSADQAGVAYTASPTGPAPRPEPISESVSSRSTDAEAKDLLALRRAKRGDAAAFAELLDTNDVAVRTLLFGLIGAEQLDRISIQTYLRAYRGLPVAPGTSPRLWLLGVADGTARDVIRRHGHGRYEPLETPIPFDLDADTRLILAAVNGVGLTPREAARLVPGGLTQVRAALGDGASGQNRTLAGPPDHRPGFWEELGRRLLIERSAPAVAARTQEQVMAANVPPSTNVPVTGESGRAARGMALRVSQQHPRRIPWRGLAAIAAVTLGVVVVVAASLSFARHASNHDAGLGETATKVLGKLDAALGNDAVITGTVTIDSRHPEDLRPGRYHFARSNIGSWQVSSTDGRIAQGYDVATGTMVALRQGSSGTRAATRQTGLAPGPPGPTGVTSDCLCDLLAESVRIVRRGTNGSVETRSAPGGVEQWVVTTDHDPTSGAHHGLLAGTGALGRIRADRITLVADRSLALPTSLTLSRAGVAVATIRFSGLTISQQPLAGSFAPEVPAGTPVRSTESGFTPSDLGRLTTANGGTVPTPSYLPPGFVIASVATNSTTHTTVSCYRNGSRQLVISHRTGPATLTDPFGDPNPDGEDPDKQHFSSGTFAGHDGWSSATPIDHVWVSTPTQSVIVSGDPPVDTLAKVVASLR